MRKKKNNYLCLFVALFMTRSLCFSASSVVKIKRWSELVRLLQMVIEKLVGLFAGLVGEVML
jgi:hypothetical protein